MTPPAVPDRALAELGRTEGGPDTLALLTRDQDTRRLLMLRAVLDAAEAADPAVCPGTARDRLREDWALLTAADRATGGGAHSPARARLTHPLTGPWARRCLTGLSPREGRLAPPERGELLRDLAHFSAVAAAAAARAGLPFTTSLTARDGVLHLPSLGALRTAEPDDVRVDVRHTDGRLTLRQPGAPDATVHLEQGTGAWSATPAWTPAHALPALVPGAAPMPLDDLDPYRVPPRDPGPYALSGPAAPDDAERKRWLQTWTGTAAVLRTGGEHRLTEALTLLRCLVPLELPPGAGGRGSCSATRREAFGALLSSAPATPVAFAATLVHELQHTKLAALGELVELHRAGPEARYFAPWRPDPRPYDGLLQGTYSHLALADFFQRRALADPTRRESAWAEHARYHAQVGAALPALVGSPDLTPVGRRFVDAMAAVHERLAERPAPRGYTARAQAYVKAVRTLWRQRQPPAPPLTNR
ncbi:HEXXH motif domain-containing protein [Streptomyces filipinensis]|uniref:HEXXH motif domain-containing protein n=1 Tax=Streptomyces filipinensis TaxID=66887 RepID=A0A918I6Z9_9ACTN|nr:HEXXH motif-containing putative peptide modification protein [Streptomyces filipinensis]GGU80311.1 HEXXH motif domain-containing protein [Streptomyces filipinensis]